MTEDVLYRLERDLIRDEGWRSHPYNCTRGHRTIGVGHKLMPHEMQAAEAGWTSEQIFKALRQDIHLAVRGCEYIFGRSRFNGFSENRQRALANMVFQMGTVGVLKFTKMVNAIYAERWDEAHKEALDSKWAREDSPERAQRVAAMLLES